MRILHLSPRVPFPPTDGGAIGIYNIVTGAAKAGNKVTLLSVNTPKHYQEGKVLKGLEEEHSVYINTNISPVKAFLNLFKEIPYIAERFISKDFENKLAEILQKQSFDVIQVEGLFVAPYINTVRKYSKAPVVVRAHNVEYVIWERLAANEENFIKKKYLQLLTKRLKKFESYYYNLFDGIAAITQEDVERIRKEGIKTPCRVIPAGVDLEGFVLNTDLLPRPKTIFILSSLDWLPNQEAVFWFVENIWPTVSENIPDLELHIAGKNTPESIFNLKTERIKVHGFVNNAKEFMQQFDLMAVPLLSGGGMRVKIIEGMAMGKPILSTSIGAEGIACSHRENILIADTTGEWINSIIDFFANRNDYKKIEFNARLLIDKMYSNSSVTQMYTDFYSELISVKKGKVPDFGGTEC